MKELIRCARALVGGEERNDYAFVIKDGIIVLAGKYGEIASRARDCEARAFPADRLVVPGFVNGHSHAYQILLRGWGDDLPFATWRSDALYKVVPKLTAEDVYWTFVAAFSEMLAAGITTVAEFFYLNGDGNERAEAAIAAARETGIRLVFARTWMDADYAPPEFRETVELAAARTAELKERFTDANVCVAPHSLHAASHGMIRAAAAFAREYDTLLHVHVAEAEYEGAETLAKHGATPIALLDRLGALDDRTVAIQDHDGKWANGFLRRCQYLLYERGGSGQLEYDYPASRDVFLLPILRIAECERRLEPCLTGYFFGDCGVPAGTDPEHIACFQLSLKRLLPRTL